MNALLFAKRSVGRFGVEFFYVGKAILDVVGGRDIVHLELVFRTGKLFVQGFQDWIGGCRFFDGSDRVSGRGGLLR